jgi:Cof subfamily protein (haloacid dehalogenase superfamily)
MSKIKLIALDMDGTTLQNDHKSISKRMKQAIKTAITQNIMVIPASGRIHSVLPSSVTSITGIDITITSNGSLVYSRKRRKVVCANYIPVRDALLVLRNLPPQIWVEVWCNDKIYLNHDQFYHLWKYSLHPLHVDIIRKIGAETENLISFIEQSKNGIEKINLPIISVAFKRKLWNLLFNRPEYSLLNTKTGIEIMNAKVSKAQGLQNLCRYFPEISMQNILAIGDSENDIDMLHTCGMGVAMGNAGECVKKAAKAVTLSNMEDGAALAIEKYALS